MSWQKLRAKLAEYQQGTVNDVEYLVICQVYHTFLDVACHFSRNAPHQERIDLNKKEHHHVFIGQVRYDIDRMKSRIDTYYHPLVEDTFEEAKDLLER